ncbi:MAG: ABC transporter substrate-binding protein [Candidatus Taylorbacteria bacterium]|nr:ABC transporter substrate-binding protein [Candidatus Taylorbacteria bacterium]
MSTMKNIYTYIGILIVIVAAFLIKGPVHNREETNVPIRIGASLSLTGVAADFGGMAKKAADLAVKEINAEGGINGRKIELYVEDDQTDPKTAVSAYRKLVDVHNVDAVIGGIFDFTAQPVLPLALKDKVTYVSPVNFVIDGTFEMNPYTFVMYPEFPQVIRELDTVIKDKKIKQLGMIRYDSGFSASIEKTLKSIMSSIGGDMVTETYKAIGSSDFRTNVLKITDASLGDKKVDAVFLDMLDFDIVKYLADTKNLGFNKQLVGYTTMRDVLSNPKVDKSQIEGAIMIDWEIPSDEFIKRFVHAYGEKPRRGANKTYDAIYMLAEAIAHTEDRQSVPEYIKSNSFNTIGGQFKFNEKHSVLTTPVKIFEIRNGVLVELKSNQ